MELRRLLVVILLVELVILVILLLSIALHRLSIYLASKRFKKKEKLLSQLIIDYLEHKKSFLPKNDPQAFSSIKTTLRVMETFNHKLEGDEWETLKKEIAQIYLLPQARKWVASPFWTRRNFAARCLALVSLIEDEQHILRLIDDSSFFVRSIASIAAVKLEKKAGVLKILKHMNQEPGYARYFYRDILLEGSKTIFSLILELSSSPQLHLTCLEVLSDRSLSSPLPFLEQDLQSNNPKIRLLALRMLIHNPTTPTESILIKFLSDPDANIRKEAAAGLASFISKNNMDKLKDTLNDPVWIVRLEAAKSLIKMSEAKDLVLNQLQIETQAYAVIQYAQQFG